MNSSCKAVLALAALSLAAAPHRALAQKIVLSGDTNIASPLDGSEQSFIDPGNQQFFRNVLGSGTGVVVENGFSISVDAGNAINNFYNSLGGVTSTEVSGPITASTLAGTNLFVSLLPATAYTSSEISALQNFSSSGGTLFFLGEHNGLPPLATADANINAALTSLGSSLQIVPSDIDPADHTISGANIAPNPLTTGVGTLTYAAASQVTGGTSLFFTQTGSAPFVAETGFAPVPEAATSVSFGLMAALGLGSLIVAGKRCKSLRA